MLLPFDFQTEPYLILDLSATNPDLVPDQRAGRLPLDLTDTARFSDYVFGQLQAAGARVGVGGYNEHRVIYRRSPHFQQQAEPREIHLGIDFWAEAGTPVFAPLDGIVHSFRDNDNFGDYGPTIILEHREVVLPAFGRKPLYSLYGHLTRASLNGLYDGKPIRTGEKIAEIGPYPENGDWPPHLHFQLMTDMLGLRGDFPGVCTEADRAKFLALCPNPNLLLGINGL
ncbi:peptidoglycan DD-metalloendopeptidase family protein [Spirosoma sordidisoli]|uniref:Peptidase M23 n=1 Tax=Spirosoma sordidisoli TaxID=2502893 RepID=A0A4Q2UQ56_9BACT|nr:peptidoglycan DD-metalloendopeptidase family protein [Spirosoma sordidisoli]RYC71877.1 peptidase M23 [Spirosoma sordidisoli]